MILTPMNKILLYRTKNGDSYVWNISTQQLLEDAYLALFKLLDPKLKNLDVMGEQCRDMARRGNHLYAKVLLMLNQSGIDGSFEEVPVMPFIPDPAPRQVIHVEIPEALLDPQPTAPLQLEPPTPKSEINKKL